MGLISLPGSRARPLCFQDKDRVVGLTHHAAGRMASRGVSCGEIAEALRPYDPENYRGGRKLTAACGLVRVVARRAPTGWTIITVWRNP